jgi:hypothetical protein
VAHSFHASIPTIETECSLLAVAIGSEYSDIDLTALLETAVLKNVSSLSYQGTSYGNGLYLEHKIISFYGATKSAARQN